MNQTRNDPVDVWLKKQPIDDTSIQLSVVVPAYNEELRLPPTLIDMVDFLDRRNERYEIIVVDDGSVDDTAHIVHKFERIRDQIRLIQLPQNEGKGAAVRMGVVNARGERVLFADADGATPIAELERLEAALDQGAAIAFGSRAMASTDTAVKTSFHRKYIGRSFNLMVNMLLLPGIADTQCGFKLMTARSAKFLFSNLTTKRYSFDVELLYIARRAGLTLAEVPVNWRNIPGSKVNLVLDSTRMFLDLLKLKFRHRAINPERFQQFISQEFPEGAPTPAGTQQA